MLVGELDEDFRGQELHYGTYRAHGLTAERFAQLDSVVEIGPRLHRQIRA